MTHENLEVVTARIYRGKSRVNTGKLIVQDGVAIAVSSLNPAEDVKVLATLS